MNTEKSIETLHRIIVQKMAVTTSAENAFERKTAGISDISNELGQLNTLLAASGGKAATNEDFLNHCLAMTSNRLMHVVQNLNYGICVGDENNNLVFLNQRFCDLFNCPVDPIDFIGKPCALMSEEVANMFLHPTAFVERHQQLMKLREPVRGEICELANRRVLLRDYCPIWSGHQFLGQIWIFEDVTERLATENKLDEQRRFYEDVLNKIPSDLVVMNKRREYLFVNRLAIKDADVRKWIIGKRDEDYFRLRGLPVEMLQMRVARIQEVIATGEQRKWEEKFILADGSVKHHLRYMYPVADESGELTLLIGYGLEITDQKRIEEQIQRSEKRYRDLFNYSEALICTHDMTGRLMSVNPAICKLLQYSEEEMIGRLISDFIPADHVKEFRSSYLDPLNEIGKCKGVFCVINKSGERTYLLYKNYKVEEDGVEPYTIGFSQDITDRVESEKELILSKKLTEETAKAKEAFLANMSHEIRTPMNGVLGFANLLVKTELNEQQRGYLKMIQESANNLLLLVNDVLDLEKILMGKLKFENIDFPMSDRVDLCLQTFTYKAEEKGITLRSDIMLSPELSVIGDPYRLSQVLNNLLSNAIKFTDRGSVVLSAKIIESVAGKLSIEFSVQDTGVGIPADKHKDIFEPFMQASAAVTRQYGGTGLGLSICRELIQMMGGQMFLDSEPGIGSNFRFILPFEISASKPKNKDMAAEINYQSLGKRKILVAEDVELNQYLARHIMESWGFEVEIAVNGREALRKVQEKTYDLVLMDIQMPEMDGMQATQHIRALSDQRVSTIPIVALTANALKGDSEKYMSVGMNDYCSKPFDESKLFTVISKNLNMLRPEFTGADHAESTADAEHVSNVDTNNATSSSSSIHLHADEKLYNLSMVEAISGGDVEFVKRMVQLFLDTMPASLKDIELAVAEERWEPLSKLAHKLKSTIDSMGIEQLKQLVRTIEANGKTGSNLQETPALVKTLVSTMQACMVQVKKDYNL